MRCAPLFTPIVLIATHACPLVLRRREERRALEEKYDALYAPIYAKRSDVINGRQEAPENETGARGCWGALAAPARGLWLRQRGGFGCASVVQLGLLGLQFQWQGALESETGVRGAA